MYKVSYGEKSVGCTCFTHKKCQTPAEVREVLRTIERLDVVSLTVKEIHEKDVTDQFTKEEPVTKNTTKTTIREWLNRCLGSGGTHLIVAVDSFSYEDYPILVLPNGNIRNEIEELQQKKIKVMEVYNLSMDIEEQLAQRRAYNL